MKTKLFGIALCLMLAACGKNYSNGSRVGVVTKLSEKGFVYKSWEGEMNMGGVREKSTDSGSAVVPNIFTFNVDASAVEKVKAAMKSGKRVELIYRQWAVAPINIGDDHVIVDVKEAE